MFGIIIVIESWLDDGPELIHELLLLGEILTSAEYCQFLPMQNEF